MQLLTVRAHLRGALLTWQTLSHAYDRLVRQTGGICTGIDALDALLRASRDGAVAAVPGDVVELIGQAGQGKTHLIYHALAQCILPARVLEPHGTAVATGAEEQGAVVFDCDFTFDLQRLEAVLVDWLLQTRPGRNASREECHTLAQEAISARLLVLRPAALDALAAALVDLGATLGQSALANTPVKLVVIDSLTAYYWQARHAEDADGGDFTARISRLMSTLQARLVENGAIALVATWNIFPAARHAYASGAQVVQRHCLTHAFTSRVALRVVVSRRSPAAIPRGTRIEDVQQQLASVMTRDTVVDAAVDVEASHALARTRGNPAFTFVIHDYGIAMRGSN